MHIKNVAIKVTQGLNPRLDYIDAINKIYSVNTAAIFYINLNFVNLVLVISVKIV